ncbi:MAG: hypothetical protein AAF797_08485 [Planctomycetota bacterium]
MPNGTGKTTTLRLLRAALSGDAASWTPKQVRELKKRGRDDDEGVFRLSMLLDDARLTVSLRLDFEEGTVSYSTTYGDGKQEGFKPPQALRRIMRPEFVNFFVFDGELANHLLKPSHTKAEGVIRDLFRLDLFDKLTARLNEHWEDLTAKKGATEPKGFNRRFNKVQDLKKRIGEVEAEFERVTEERDRVKSALLEQKNKFDKAILEREQYAARLSKATGELEQARAAADGEASRLLTRLRSPHAVSPVLAGEMATLTASLDRVKLPESTAKEFFEELAEEAECVCGRPLNEETRRHIRERAKRYLGAEEMNLLNTLKAEVKAHVGGSAGDERAKVNADVERLKQSLRSRKQAQQDKEEVEREAAGDDPKLDAARRQIANLEQQLLDLDNQVRRYEDRDESRGDKDTLGLDVLRTRLARAEKKLAEITRTLDLKERRDRLASILETARDKAAAGIKREVVRQTNERIDELMKQNALRVKNIRGCLVLEHPESGSVQQEGSVGENLSVAYAFLATLFNRSGEHELPFIVDSPAGPLDHQKRTKVAGLIPKLTSQFLAFVISTEQADFVEPLEKALAKAGGGKPLYLTLFHDGRVPDLGATVGTRDGDGRLVTGREFFVNIRDVLKDEEVD